MSEPTSFTQEAIRDFMILRGGKVTNHELVKHFKKFLTNPATQEEARVLFKEYVNTLATITRDPDGGKQLVLKKKFRTPSIDQSFNTSGLPATPLSPSPLSPLETPTLNLRYQPVYQSSYELDLGSPHRSPYRRLSSESLSPSYSLRSPGTPTSSYAPTFPPSSGYQQLVTPLGYVPPSVPHTPNPTSPGYHQEPPIGIPTGPVGMPSPSRMVPLAPAPLGKQNSSPSLPSIPSAVGISTSSVPPLGIHHSSSASSITSNSPSQNQYKTSQSPMVQHKFHPQMARRQSSIDSVFTDPNPSPRENDPPPVPPRRRSSEKSLTKMDLKELEDFKSKGPGAPTTQSGPTAAPTQEETPMDTKPDDNKENVAEDSKISVKERMQKFDRMASESALLNKTVSTSSLHTNLYKKRQEKERDEDDTGSVNLIDGKTRDWLVKCAQGDYQAIVKMAAENPRLVKFKDPSQGTALHWGAKHGNEDVIKLIAGKYSANVNGKTNGGYTPLHIAMQYGHDECYNLLVEVYGADPNVRDYSGRKPRQYQTNKGTSVSVDTFRKIKAMKKHAAEKDLGFLRIGSLNVRVKRTTEAFSHFLGVGNPEKLHKHWGSADNLHQGDNKRMPPPKFAPIKKRKSKRAQDFGVPIRAQSLIEKPSKPGDPINQDSDSDTAAGFGSQWQSTV